MSDLQEITGLFTNEAIQVMAEAYDVALDVSFQKGRSRNKCMYLVQRKKIYKKKTLFFLRETLWFFSTLGSQEMMEDWISELSKLDRKKN